MKTLHISALITFTAATLSACATSAPALEAHSDNFGKANKSNMAAHFVPPTPEQKANTYIPADASRRALAKERYRKDEVEKPVSVGTMK